MDKNRQGRLNTNQNNQISLLISKVNCPINERCFVGIVDIVNIVMLIQFYVDIVY